MSTPTKQQIARWKKNRKAWVKALRSGDFKQGRKQLVNRVNGSDVFCCLGVLCDLAGIPRPDGQFVGHTENNTKATKAACDWVGLTSRGGSYFPRQPHSGRTALWRRNDQGATFEQIARIIEREPSSLFRESVEATE